MQPAQYLFHVQKYLILTDSGDGSRGVVTKFSTFGQNTGAKRLLSHVGMSSAQEQGQNITPEPGLGPLGQIDAQVTDT